MSASSTILPLGPAVTSANSTFTAPANSTSTDSSKNTVDIIVGVVCGVAGTASIVVLLIGCYICLRGKRVYIEPEDDTTIVSGSPDEGHENEVGCHCDHQSRQDNFLEVPHASPEMMTRTPSPGEQLIARYEALSQQMEEASTPEDEEGGEMLEEEEEDERPITPCPAYTPVVPDRERHHEGSEAGTPGERSMLCYHVYRPSLPELAPSQSVRRQQQMDGESSGGEQSVARSQGFSPVSHGSQAQSEIHELGGPCLAAVHELDHNPMLIPQARDASGLDGQSTPTPSSCCRAITPAVDKLPTSSKASIIAGSHHQYQVSSASLHELPSLTSEPALPTILAQRATSAALPPRIQAMSSDEWKEAVTNNETAPERPPKIPIARDGSALFELGEH